MKAPCTEEDDVKGVEADRCWMLRAADCETIWYRGAGFDQDVLALLAAWTRLKLWTMDRRHAASQRPLENIHFH